MTKATAALAAAGIDIAEVEPQLILKAIAADVSAPASARVSGCRKLIDHQTDRELREANNAALASSVNSRRSHRWTRTLLVPVSKRDHDIRCLRFVQLQTRCSESGHCGLPEQLANGPRLVLVTRRAPITAGPVQNEGGGHR